MFELNAVLYLINKTDGRMTAFKENLTRIQPIYHNLDLVKVFNFCGSVLGVSSQGVLVKVNDDLTQTEIAPFRNTTWTGDVLFKGERKN